MGRKRGVGSQHHRISEAQAGSQVLGMVGLPPHISSWPGSLISSSSQSSTPKDQTSAPAETLLALPISGAMWRSAALYSHTHDRHVECSISTGSVYMCRADAHRSSFQAPLLSGLLHGATLVLPASARVN